MKRIHFYVAGVIAAGALVLLLKDWSVFFGFSVESLIGFGALTFLGVVAQGAAVRTAGDRGATWATITFLPLFACILLFGTEASILFIAVTAAIAEFFIRKKETAKALFNVAQYVVAVAAAGSAFTLVGGSPLTLRGVGGDGAFDPQLAPFAAFGVIFLLLNNLLVLLAISLSQEAPVGRTFYRLAQQQIPAFLHAVLISPLGVLLAFLYFELGILGLVISVLPLVFVRHSYLSAHQLEHANRDLLKALVKAIETRDPYTMGHSVRVQRLSERIGRRMGLSDRRLEDLRTAAVLHDIGKIEIMYEDILRKPGALSARERRIIESHVTRGVELLTSLSSLRDGVIEGVRHHHESLDGSGYPDGLVGAEIPLHARIINVSDAVDAMLSDRPYRKALSVNKVYEELRRCAGSQFDPQLVQIMVEGELIEKHQEDMVSLRGAADFGGRDDSRRRSRVSEERKARPRPLLAAD